MTYGEWIESLQILAKSAPADDGDCVIGTKGMVFCATGEVAADDRTRLEALGWSQTLDCWVHVAL